MLGIKDLLRKALLADAAFSGLCGLVLIFASAPLAGLLGPGAPASWPTAVGVASLGFAVALLAIAWQREPAPFPAAVVIGANALWVLGSLAVLAAFSDQLSTAGFWLIAAQAAIVAELALIQGLGLRRRLQNGAVATAPTA